MAKLSGHVRGRILDAARPVYAFALGTNERGEPVAIPMRPTLDGGIESAPLGETATVCGLWDGERLLPLRG